VRQEVVRFTDHDGTATNPEVIISNLPATEDKDHNGGRIVFGPDGKLYIAIGDTAVAERAQNLESWAGKILRFDPNGDIPIDNPFPGSPVYALGFRNVFGLDFHPVTGDLYVTENGPEAGDAINLVKAGSNYGWPLQKVGGAPPQFEKPIFEWTSVIVPTGMTFHPEYPDVLLFCSFNEGNLQALDLTSLSSGQTPKIVKLLDGCLLDVKVGPDGVVYIASVSAISRIENFGAILNTQK
jgi:glucose/arabinose dehydrogenase